MYKIRSSEEVKKPQQYGGKAKGLFFLQQNGFQTPPFYLVGYEALSAIQRGEIELTQLVKKWKNDFHIDSGSLWAVRSSASIEDGTEKSFAGLFNSQVNVTLNQLPAAIKSVLHAFEEVKGLNYDVANTFTFGIIIQEMIRSEYSGVAFSHNPMKPSQETPLLNIVPGIGENLVSGKVEAFMIQKERSKIIYLNDHEQFEGERYDAGLHPVSISGQALKQAVKPYVKPLFKGLKKLAQLNDFPADCEFTIANDTLYWLQVRPITAPENEVIAIYDNGNISENYPGLTLPLSISFAKHTYRKAYVGMGKFLGMSEKFIAENEDRLSNMVGGIYGKMYYNLTAWQQLLFQLPFGKKTSKLLPKLWSMDEAAFDKPSWMPSVWGYLRIFSRLIWAFLSFGRLKKSFDALYEHEMNTFDRGRLEKLNHEELVDFYQSFEKRLGGNWIVPVLNGFFAMLTLSSLKWVLKRSRLHTSHPNFINDVLFAQGDVISVKIVKDFQALSTAIRANPSLLDFFQNNEDEAVLKNLPNAFPEFFTNMQKYLDQFGERAVEGELQMETVNYQDNPHLLIAFLRESSSVDIPQKVDTQKFHYSEIIRREYARNFLKKWILNTLIKITIPRIRDRENYRFYRTKSFAIARTAFRQMGRALFHTSKLQQPEDFLYLEFAEIMNPSVSQAYISIVEERKQNYQAYKEVNHAPRYHKMKKGWVPIEKQDIEGATDHLKGTGCCSGIVKGKVVIITGPSLPEGEKGGGIFIANHFEPGWINLFSQASGVISERGNLLSHTAILCREMGIPSIVGVKGLMRKLQAGDTIQMNGGTGDILLLDQEANQENI